MVTSNSGLYMKRKIAFLTFSSELLREDKILSSKLYELIEKDCKLDIQYRWFENNQRKTPQKIYLDSLNAIRKADFFIADASIKSNSVGQQIGYAIQQKKPCFILLKNESRGTKESLFLKGTRNSNVYFIYYSNIEDLKVKLYSNIQSIKDSKPEKFNFLATKRIRNILLMESRKRNVTQSELLREIIEEWIAKNYADEHKN